MTNIDVLESGGANMTGQIQKHAVKKTFINFFYYDYYHRRLGEPGSGSGAVFSLACAITGSVFTFQPISGILSKLTKSISSSSDCPQQKRRRDSELQS